MIERPLDRLNYYNGQRLEASDLKLEQEYHIRVRRWINKSLYTPGICRGLEVRAEKDTRFVIVSPGLALDGEGRELLLLEEERICAPGTPRKKNSGSEAEVEGLYLTIRYSEEPIQEERNGCIVKSVKGKKTGDHAAWGGPALVRAKPLFNWSDALPYESSGEIVLAQVELTPDCTKVHQVNAGIRRYVGAASSAKVRQYALEGERHIDKNNPGKIYFHVRGRQPNAVTLYLRADEFSTLYYTEMGQHLHGLAIDADVETKGPVFTPDENNPTKYMHRHTFKNNLKTLDDGNDGTHDTHTLNISFSGKKPGDTPGYLAVEPFQYQGVSPVRFRVPAFGNILPALDDVLDDAPTNTLRRKATISDGPHHHTIQAVPTEYVNPFADDDHTHMVTPTASMNPAGVYSDPNFPSPQPVPNEYLARSGAPLKYVNDLKIKIDGVPVKDAIIAQLKDADPTWFTHSQAKLGDGNANHPLVEKGTGEIKLDFLPGVYFLEGEHSIELTVEGEGNGGRILYNLYVE